MGPFYIATLLRPEKVKGQEVTNPARFYEIRTGIPSFMAKCTENQIPNPGYLNLKSEFGA